MEKRKVPNSSPEKGEGRVLSGFAEKKRGEKGEEEVWPAPTAREKATTLRSPKGEEKEIECGEKKGKKEDGPPAFFLLQKETKKGGPWSPLRGERGKKKKKDRPPAGCRVKEETYL